MGFKVKAFENYKSDEKLESEGKVADIAPGVWMRVRRLRSKPVLDARKKIYGPHERAMNGKDLPDQIETMCTIRLLAEAVVVDWGGDEMKDDVTGDPIPFSVENAKELFGDPDTGKDLRSLVINFANDSEFFSPEDKEIDLGNSATS